MQNSKIFKDRVSEKRLLNNDKEISNFHRIQASPMYREAANYVMQKCAKLGLDAKLLEYEANPDKWYMASKMFKEWTINEATLDLVDPDIRLADFSAEAVSVVQKSYPIDLRDTPVDLVLLDKGADPAAYGDLDLNGKWCFVRGWLTQYNWIFDKGALGLVTDFIMETPSRSRNDLYHSLTYTSYWHTHAADETEKRGFVLSPCEGDKLAAMCKAKWEKDHSYLQVKPYINSSFADGFIEIIEITIPGKDDKTVYLTSHLCHPRSSCNDNASGVSCNLEAMYVINSLIKEGKLPQPQHTIKCVLIPEFTGTFPYLSDHTDYENGLGALNLDMVGARQTRKYGPITLTKTPLALPSVNNEIAAYALAMAGKEAKSLDGNDVALTNNRIEPYSGGSDHTIYSDPSIGIPCNMLGQWPDLNYHTSTDTLDVLDPEVMKFSCLVACNFAWNLANLTEADLPYIYEELEKDMISTKADLVKDMVDPFVAPTAGIDNGLPFNSGDPGHTPLDKVTFGGLLAKYKNYYVESVKSVKKLVEGADTTKMEQHVANMFDEWMSFYGVDGEYPTHDELTTVYKRKFKGPIHQISDFEALGKGDVLAAYHKKAGGRWATQGVQEKTIFYIDGKRTLAEVVKEVSLERKKDSKDQVLYFVECLLGLDLIEEA